MTKPHPPPLDIRLLGPPEILVAGRPIVVDTRKAIAILAVLAAERRAFARDELAALLWPDADDAAARGAFRRTLSALRAAVGENVLVVDRTRVDLVRDHVRIDLLDLERLAGSADRGGLEHAAALARGPFLAGFALRDSPDFDDWRAARAITAERTVNTVLDRLSAALEIAGDLPGAIAIAGRRVDLDPLDEGAHVRLMDLSAAAGDRAGAMRQYRACVAILERELGVAPLPETAARYEAIRDAIPADPAARRAAPGRRHLGLPLVGRDQDMAALIDAQSAAERDGRVVVLTGEAGIGKTRLAETFVSQARAAGSTVLTARAHVAEQAIAYGPIVELLRAGQADPASADRLRRLDGASLADLARLLPTVEGAARGTDVHGPGAHARLVTAIAEALVAAVSGTRPGIVWVDDVQWVDAESLEALAYLARRLTGRSVLLLLTWRHDELDASALSFARQVEALPAVTTVELERLDRDDVEALVAAATGVAEPAASLVDPLVTASEGLPLYVVEVLAGGHTSPDGMPDGVRAVLRQRLAAVDGLSEQVLAAAAAIGRSFDFATVRHASGRSEDETVQALDDLLRRGLIRELAERPDPSDAVSGRSATAPTSPVLRYDFAHAALRDLAEASTSLARRRLLHRRIAEALRMDLGGVGRDDLGRLVRIAQHERDAGRDAEAAEAFREAGDRASGLFANVDAISHYAAAVALGHPDVVGLHAAIGGLRTRLGDYAGAIAALESAAALASPADLPPLELALARAHFRRGDLTAADRYLEAGLAVTQDRGIRARMLVDRALVRRRTRDVDGAAKAAAAALADATVTGDTASMGAAHRIIGLTALDRGDLAGARRSLDLALSAAADDPDPIAGISALVGLAMTDAADGDIDSAVTRGGSAVEACRRIGDRHLEAAVENHLADMLHAAGRETASMEHLRRAVEAFAEVGGDPADPDPGIWMLAAS